MRGFRRSWPSAALTGDRLQGELRARADEIEARLALGFSGREAMQPLVRASLRAAMIPTVNGMMTVGLVQLSGMMTGQILAGSSPLRDPIPDRRRLHAGRGHRHGLASLRPARGRTVPDERPPAPALPPVAGRDAEHAVAPSLDTPCLAGYT